MVIDDGPDEGKRLTAPSALLATGCRVRYLLDLVADGRRILASREALEMPELPESIVTGGAGAIRAEFANFLNSMGSTVVLVEMLPRVLPVEDEEVLETLSRAFRKQGMEIHTNTRVENG